MRKAWQIDNHSLKVSKKLECRAFYLVGHAILLIVCKVARFYMSVKCGPVGVLMDVSAKWRTGKLPGEDRFSAGSDGPQRPDEGEWSGLDNASLCFVSLSR